MSLNGRSFDPFCDRDFWREQLGTRSLSELQEYIENFEYFSESMEREFRFVMSVSRAEACREAVMDLIQQKMAESGDSRQGDLFG